MKLLNKDSLSGLAPLDKTINRGRGSLAGFTLIEVLIAMSILAFCLSGLLATYVNMFFLTSLLRDSTLATNAVQAKMEEISHTEHDCLFTPACQPCVSPCVNCYCNNSQFSLDGITDGKGVIEIGTVAGYTDLKKVRVVACFRSRGRVIGNDIDNCTSSPVEAVTYIAK